MSRSFPISLLVGLLVCTLGLAAVSAANRARLAAAGNTQATGSVRLSDSTPPTVPNETATITIRHPAPPKRPPEFTVEVVRKGRAVALHTRPSGDVVARIGATTQFGSPQTLTVVARHGRWLGVTTSELANGSIGWVDSKSPALQATATPISLRVSLSRRELEVVDAHRVVRRVLIGIGAADSPTPLGRFSVTDKISGPSINATYGCCILALSGHQPAAPAGWPGGNRLAIHGTEDPSTIGAAATAGCLHAEADDLEALMRRVPLGTPVFISS